MAEAGALSFEGRPVPVRPGQSVAAALVAAGERQFRETLSGARRSVFCGMGICQDCLLEIDGVPSRRACMEKARPGMAVRRQPARPAPGGPVPGPGPAELLAPDLLVVGGGAGGLAAAAVAAEAGARVLLLDERRTAGGQFYKQAALGGPLDRQQSEGAALVARAAAAGAELRGGTEVWGGFEGPVFAAAAGTAALVIRPRATILATGAFERPRMVPGWQLPGVMTTGAAQTLWRSDRTLPGRRVLVAGNGPLNIQVALELAAGGARVVAVAEAAPPPWTRPGAARRMVAADPSLAARGAGMLASLAARGVPVRYRTVLTAVEAVPGGLRAHLAGPGHRSAVEVDAVLMNDGFEPANELMRLLGCTMEWDARHRQLRAVRSQQCATSVAGIWAVGDCCGLGGAPAALAEGRIAGAAAARQLGFAAAEPAAARRALARARAFQAALWSLWAPAAPALPLPPDALLCRCEEVTRGTVAAAIAAGPGDIGALKRATRAGMGRCQGRYCGPELVRLLAEATGRPPGDRAFAAPRPPVKPVPLAAILAAAAVLPDLEAGP